MAYIQDLAQVGAGENESGEGSEVNNCQHIGSTCGRLDGTFVDRIARTIRNRLDWGHEKSGATELNPKKNAISHNALDPSLRSEGLQLSEGVQYKGTGRNIFRAGIPPLRILPAPGPKALAARPIDQALADSSSEVLWFLQQSRRRQENLSIERRKRVHCKRRRDRQRSLPNPSYKTDIRRGGRPSRRCSSDALAGPRLKKALG